MDLITAAAIPEPNLLAFETASLEIAPLDTISLETTPPADEYTLKNPNDLSLLVAGGVVLFSIAGAAFKMHRDKKAAEKLYLLGKHLLSEKKYEEAISALAAALKRHHPNILRRARIESLRGQAHAHLGHHDKAITAYRKAQDLFIRMKNVDAVLDMNNHLSLLFFEKAKLYADGSKLEEALKAVEEAQTTSIFADDPRISFDIQMFRAHLLEKSARLTDAALAYHAIVRRFAKSDLYKAAVASGEEGRVHRAANNFEKAIEAYGHSFGLHIKIENLEDAAIMAKQAGEICILVQNREHYQRALIFLQYAAGYFDSIEDGASLALVSYLQGVAQIKMGYTGEAVHSLGIAIDLNVELEKKEEAAEAACLLGETLLQAGDLELAVDAFDTAQCLYDALGSLPKQAEASMMIGHISMKQNNLQLAATAFARARLLYFHAGEHKKSADGTMYEGFALFKMGWRETAAGSFRSAAEIFRLHGHPDLAAYAETFAAIAEAEAKTLAHGPNLLTQAIGAFDRAESAGVSDFATLVLEAGQNLSGTSN